MAYWTALAGMGNRYEMSHEVATLIADYDCCLVNLMDVEASKLTHLHLTCRGAGMEKADHKFVYDASYARGGGPKAGDPISAKDAESCILVHQLREGWRASLELHIYRKTGLMSVIGMVTSNMGLAIPAIFGTFLYKGPLPIEEIQLWGGPGITLSGREPYVYGMEEDGHVSK